MRIQGDFPASAGRRAALWLIGTSFIAAFAAAAPAHAQGTAAGTVITNQAQAVYELPGGGDSPPILSEEVKILVDEVLDVDVTAEPDVTVATPSTGQMLTFTVTNVGNGSEAFKLAVTQAAGDDFDPSNFTIYYDADGDDQYDAGAETEYTGANYPTIAANGHVKVFVFADIEAGLEDGDTGGLVLTATAVTGSGTPGADVGNDTGPNGTWNVIVGASGGEDEDTGNYVVEVEPPPPTPTLTLAKSINAIADPFGGTTARVSGSEITYQIVATLTGTGTLNNLRILDNIPVGTTYVAGSLTLESAALTDAADTDAGKFVDTAGTDSIEVALGSVTSPATRTVTFKVKVDGATFDPTP